MFKDRYNNTAGQKFTKTILSIYGPSGISFQKLMSCWTKVGSYFADALNMMADVLSKQER